MKKIANQVITALAGLFRSKSDTIKSSSAPQGNPQKTDTDETEFCNHPRHGAFPPRRRYKASGVSAHGYAFKIFQCPAPGCGEFIARTIDSATGVERILFRGKFYNPRRETAPPAPFKPIRAASAAA
jgi:hypothetical protein